MWVGAGERVSAVVEMDRPGVWVFGEVSDDDRKRGMGIVVEYAGCGGDPNWRRPIAAGWNYGGFGGKPGTRSQRASCETLNMVFARQDGGRGGFCRWTVNGQAFSSKDRRPSFHIREGRRYKMCLRNATDDTQTVHLRRHRFELTRIDGIETRGIIKDVVMVGAQRSVEVEFVADNPGRTLLHSTRQWQMDFGLAASIDYV